MSKKIVKENTDNKETLTYYSLSKKLYLKEKELLSKKIESLKKQINCNADYLKSKIEEKQILEKELEDLNKLQSNFN